MAAKPKELDWSDRQHWGRDLRPCRHCGGVTYLRDDLGRPSHKICAESTTESTTEPTRTS